MAKAALVGIREFARVVKVGENSVRYAMQVGRLSFKTVKGRRMIDPVKGKKQWAATLDRTASEKRKGKTLKKKKVSSRYSYEAPPKTDKDGDLTAAEADRREKVNRSKLSELRYLEQAGKLIEVDKVKRRAFETGRKTRDAIMGIPPKLCHELAAETNPHKLEVMLTKALQKALQKIIKEGEKK